MNRNHRSARRFAGGTATLVVALLVLSGSASASTSSAKSHSTVYSAAHSQYGNAHVLKPTVLGTSKTKPSAAPAAKPLATTKSAGTLPFTGLSLLKVLLVALGMLVLGVMLRQPLRSRKR